MDMLFTDLVLILYNYAICVNLKVIETTFYADIIIPVGLISKKKGQI